MNMIQYIGRQFGYPTGFGGILSTWVMNRMNNKQYQAVMHALKMIGNGDNVLEIGFGNGYLMNRIVKSNECCLTGIEISEDMLALAGKRNKSAIAKGKMHLEIGNVVDLGFPDALFEWAYTVNTIYFWSNLDSGMSEIYRVLKPGGKFIDAFYTKQFLDRLRYTQYGFAKYSPEEIRQAALKAGFIIEDEDAITQGMSYCLVLRKAAT